LSAELEYLSFNAFRPIAVPSVEPGHGGREGGDVFEDAGEPHFPQRGPAASQPLSQLPGRTPGLVAGLAEVRRLDRHLEGGGAGHGDRPVRGVGMDRRDIADQVADPAQPVEVEHDPVAGPMAGSTEFVELGGHRRGDDLLWAGVPGLGAGAERVPGGRAG
jgi:hypothetical protein